MQKKNQPLIGKAPQTLAKQVIVEGSSYLPADGVGALSPRDTAAEMKRGTDLLNQGVAKPSHEDLVAGVNITTGVANAVTGADPMRKAIEEYPNSDCIPAAAKEMLDNFDTLAAENSGVARRTDLDSLKKDIEERAKVVALNEIYTARQTETKTLIRYYDSRIAPTLIDFYKSCEGTITVHAGLQGRMPNLTKLSVGTGQDAAKSRSRNERVRMGAREEGAAAARTEAAAAAPAAAPQTTTTVSTPAAGPAPISTGAAAPAPAARQPTGRGLKR